MFMASPLGSDGNATVAGCGPGLHAISSAHEYQDSRVLAVDLSAPSLAFAQRRAAELGVGNIEFLQADLLDLDRLERRFDVIESVGVLHHLADPSAGGRVLRGLLAPGGYMKLGLYSELARGAVVAARRLIAQRDDSPTPAGIRAARDAILRLPADAPAAGVAASGDFYSTSGVRDLLFHVQEHRFTLPETAALVGRLELEFLGFVLDDSVLRDYRQAEPDDPEARSLERWSRYEATHPETFGEMYQFWLRAPSEPA
jgi:SAM-dependent methyltransferase